MWVAMQRAGYVIGEEGDSARNGRLIPRADDDGELMAMQTIIQVTGN